MIKIWFDDFWIGFDNFQPLCSMKNLEKLNKFYDTYSMGNNSSSTI